MISGYLCGTFITLRVFYVNIYIAREKYSDPNTFFNRNAHSNQKANWSVGWLINLLSFHATNLLTLPTHKHTHTPSASAIGLRRRRRGGVRRTAHETHVWAAYRIARRRRRRPAHVYLIIKLHSPTPPSPSNLDVFIVKRCMRYVSNTRMHSHTRWRW